MKLTDYAKIVGVHHRTARRWYHEGLIPGAYQLPTGTIIVPDNNTHNNNTPEKENNKKTVIYARVSSSEQRKTNLEYQADRLVKFCIANGWIVDKVVKEVGSGMNDNRPLLNKILTDNSTVRIIVEHKDRLTRFGYHYIELLAQAKGIEIVIVNKTNDDKEDLLEDLISITTSFCARIYGQRLAKRKTEIITEELLGNEIS